MDSNDRFMDQITKGRKAERRTAEYGKGDEESYKRAMPFREPVAGVNRRDSRPVHFRSSWR